MIQPSGVDDTPTIQAALDAKGYAELDTGTFLVSSLNLTGRQSPAIYGKGSLSTKLQPTQNGVNVIDCTGSTNVKLADFRVAGHGARVTPNIGILCAQNPNAESDVFSLDGVRVDGNFGIAAWYCYAVQSSRVMGGQFYNYQPGAITAILTSSNPWGVQSQFTQIRTVDDMLVSDWEIIATEFHNMASGWAGWFGGLQEVKFRGGNFSSSGPIVSNNAVVMAWGQWNPEHVVLDGVTLYSDFAPHAPYALSGMVTEPNLTLRNVKSTVPLTQ